VLRSAGKSPVAILDLDLHYPNGTAAIMESMEDVFLYSVHASPVTNVAEGTVDPATDREVAVEFVVVPDTQHYVETVTRALGELREECDPAVLVLSLGYDIVAGDPHGCWKFGPEIFTEIGRLLAEYELPICVVQEGGYALDKLADCSEAFAIGLLDRPAPQAPPEKAPRFVALSRNGSGP
jgi:acetoin utilization deacetylase AcuC-like enzyme